MRYRCLLILWLASDLFLFLGSFALAYFLRVGFILSSDFPFGPFIAAAAMASPFWLLVLATTRTFALGRRQQTLRNLAYIAYASVVGCALFALLYYFLYDVFFSRLLIVFAFAISTGAAWIWHIIFERMLRIALTKDPPQFPTLIIGVTRESRRLIALLKCSRNPLFPVAILDGLGVKEQEIEGVPICGKLNKLEEVLKERKITHLIQCSDLEQSLNLLSACRSRAITYMVLPSVFGIVERDEKIESLEGHAVTVVGPPRRWWEWFF
ncbi:hypothetical protein HY285_00780 [Candidatus Peregrinibacteria bacterium]|nr:hypothetical protein [Candidatus Peregrinibacteria bacterium]MBI3816064.1 hypothetical protein [Candidatus Peregrinibacteria bacterium]